MTRSSTEKIGFLAAGLCLVGLLAGSGCGYRFGAASDKTPFPPDIKTIVIKSAVNNTTITGIETELTNDLREEFALGTRLKPVRSGGQVVLDTVIATYDDTPAIYKADSKELTRVGTLKVACNLERADTREKLWQKVFTASHSYLVTDSISETLTNRRRAISSMIKDLIFRIHTSLYDNF
ncbi:MAG: LPS assembly lipoprotein LptE [Desulfomonile sp.]|nr:LPS assembly lipoprotein LptE [Desulfomonile sp.]